MKEVKHTYNVCKPLPDIKKKNHLDHLLNLQSNHFYTKQQVENFEGEKQLQKKKPSSFKAEYFDVGPRGLSLFSKNQSSGKGGIGFFLV